MAKNAKNSTEALIKKKMGNWKGPIERVTRTPIPILEGGEADTKGKMSKEVKAVFVNIFGGILKCDVLTQSILNAAQQVGLKKKIVLRLKGTNADIAKGMLEGK